MVVGSSLLLERIRLKSVSETEFICTGYVQLNGSPVPNLYSLRYRSYNTTEQLNSLELDHLLRRCKIMSAIPNVDANWNYIVKRFICDLIMLIWHYLVVVCFMINMMHSVVSLIICLYTKQRTILVVPTSRC